MKGNPGRLSFAVAVAALMLALVPAGASARSAEQRLLASVNHARQANGVRPLRPSSNLGASARHYSEYMVARHYFGHMTRIHASWSRWSWVGENLAMYPGWGTQVDGIVRSWLASPVHRSVMLSTRFSSAGVGYAHGTMGGRRATTVTLHLGRAK